MKCINFYKPNSIILTMSIGDRRKKIFIAEDSECDFEQTKKILGKIRKDTGYNFLCFPEALDDFYKVRAKINHLLLPNKEMRDIALDYLKESISDSDLLLLDYRLAPKGNDHNPWFNGVELYEKLETKTDALIYTNFWLTGGIENIRQNIRRAGLSSNIHDVIHKARLYDGFGDINKSATKDGAERLKEPILKLL